MDVEPGAALGAVPGRVADLLAAVPERLLLDYRAAAVGRAQETPWRTDGANGYAWRFCCRAPSLYRLRETRAATVIVRNEGDALWLEAAKYRFGQKEFLDPVLFGDGRYLINDTQDDIPTYGGIFRGRPKTFTLSLRAPATPGWLTFCNR